MAASNLSFVFDEECTSSIVQQVCKVKDGINDLDLIKELLGKLSVSVKFQESFPTIFTLQINKFWVFYIFIGSK